MITIKNIEKRYGEQKVLKDISFTVDEKRIYGLLGKNGAGKSTLFKMLLGLISPTSGVSYVNGLDCQKERQRILKLVGTTIEQPKFYLHLNAFDNLSIHLSYMGAMPDTHAMLIKNALKRVGLDDKNEKLVANYSLGMKQRLAIARAIIHKPKVLILDEPINGLDPKGIRDMRELFLELSNKEKMTILFSSHILSEVMSVADHIIVLCNGDISLNESKEIIVSTHTADLESYLIKTMEELKNA